MPQKAHHCAPRKGLRLHLHQQASQRGNPRDHRQMIMWRGHAQDRGLAPWGIRADPSAQQIEPRLVYPDDGSPLLIGFFLILGHSVAYQAAISASSRWL